MKIQKSFLFAFGFFTLTVVVFYPQLNTFAANRKGEPKVKSARQRCHVCNCGAVICKCKKRNKFKTGDGVYVMGKRFTPLDTVDIYVTSNKVWNLGDPINADESTDGVEAVATDSDGKIPCTMIWGSPVASGRYDIVVDANQDGIYNAGDAIDGKVKVGFKVE